MFLPIFTVHLSQTESIFGYIKLKIVKGKNSLFVQHMMTLTKCAKNTLLTRELSNKNARGCHILISCVPDYLGVNTAQHRTRLGRGSLGQAPH